MFKYVNSSKTFNRAVLNQNWPVWQNNLISLLPLGMIGIHCLDLKVNILGIPKR